MIGESEEFVKAKELAREASKSKSAILISGESGTGKELLARMIHHSGESAKGPFAVIDDSRENLSELIGGLAHIGGGTIFFDEIGELPLKAQAQLVRFLQGQEIQSGDGSSAGQVDARIIAATKEDLKKGLLLGTFWADLYFELNKFPIHLPPLRERSGDLLLLMDHFLDKHRTRSGRIPRGFTKEVRQAFLDYRWPGNVRELEGAVEFGIVMAEGEYIGQADLPERIRQGRNSPT